MERGEWLDWVEATMLIVLWSAVGIFWIGNSVWIVVMVVLF